MATFRNMFLGIGVILIIINNVLGKSNVIKLDENNWDQMLQNEWMVEFYAPWCPACKALQTTWEEFSSWSHDLNIEVGQVDVTVSPGLSGRFMVTALPTIYHVLNGEFRQYRGARDKDAFISFIEDKKWKNVEAISSWKSPSSFQMSIVSYFFKLSQILRGIHNQLMEEYGIPTWGSYVIFALATILFGALLGLVLVCIIDCVYPPKHIQQPALYAQEKDALTEFIDDQQSIDEVDKGITDDLVDENEEAHLSDATASQSEGDSDPEAESQGSPNIRKRKPRKAD